MAKSRTKHVQCSFLIPERGDRQLSDGAVHPDAHWEWLKAQLRESFGGATEAPGLYRGFYGDPDTGQQVWDESRRFIIAMPRSKVRLLRRLLKRACIMFHQKCIYLSVAGEVEFIESPDR